MIFKYGNIDVFYDLVSEYDASLPSVIFLHGWGCDHSVFASFTGIFDGRYNVFGMDFPGFGFSAEPDSVWGVEQYTAMLESFVGALSIRDVSLVGHSFGGRVAILFASRNPVTRIVLTDAAGVKPHRSLKYYIKVYSYKTAKFIVTRIMRSEILYRRLVGGTGSSDYRNASPRMKAILSKVVNEDLCDRMPLITAPTLLFWGENDTATPLSDARRMEKLIPDAGLVSVPGGSHFSFLDAPGLYASVLKSFFQI